jgi:hypothetical protein
MAESSDAITGKFDFYDILGYLVPGLVLLGLLALPFGLIKGIWPSTSFTSAILYLVGAYIVGHILQGFLRAWEDVPKIRDSNGKMRTPSSVLLDEDPAPCGPQRHGTKPLFRAVRAKIRRLTYKFWDIPKTLKSNNENWDDVLEPERAAAFLQARNLLLQSNKGSYFEQFQGKYALMGGVAAGLIVASAYYGGWAAALAPLSFVTSFSKSGPYILVAFVAVLVVCLAFIRSPNVSRTLLKLVFFLLLVGVFLGGFVANSASKKPPEIQQCAETEKGKCGVCFVCSAGHSGNESEGFPGFQIEHQATLMLILALLALGAAIRCYGAYEAFAKEFAMGVWRDFANFDLLTATDEESKNKK